MIISRLIHVAAGSLLVASSALGWFGSSANVARTPPAPTVEASKTAPYMPLTPSRVMIYADPNGDRFTLTFGAPTEVTWFDGTTREIIPMGDTRCDCRYLLRNLNGEVQAIGTMWNGGIERWGEPIVIFPASYTGRSEAVATPAGQFPDAARIDTGSASAWFARGVGMIKVGEYHLVKVRPAGVY